MDTGAGRYGEVVPSRLPHWSAGPDPTASVRGTVWLTYLSADIVDDVAARLGGLNLEVRMIPATSHDSAMTDLGSGGDRSAHRGGLAPGVLRRVREAIDSRLSASIKLTELADLAGLSTCHFARAFKQSIGVPPHRFIVERRIAYAMQLVRQTSQPFTDIALAVGFSDHSHFTRTFVRVVGETPRACRRRHR